MGKITGYAALTQPASGDLLLAVDVSDTSMAATGTDKQITVASLRGGAEVSVLDYGADPSGTSDSHSAFASAISAVTSTGGRIRVPGPGTYKIGSTVSIDPGTKQVVLDCEPGVIFNWTGTTGACLSMRCGTAGQFGQGSGILGNPTIDGTNGSAGTVGVDFGDIFEGRIDVTTNNFTGTASRGTQFANLKQYTERLTARVSVSNCTAGVVFDVPSGASSTATGSFFRLKADILGSMKVDQDMVVFQRGARVDGLRGLSISGNMNAKSSAMTNCVLRLTGQVSTGGSDDGSYCSLNGGHLLIDVECNQDSGTNAPATILFGTPGGSSEFIYGCSGFMGFASDLPFAASNNGGNIASFFGPIYGDDSGLSGSSGINSVFVAPQIAMGTYSGYTTVSANNTTQTPPQGGIMRLTTTSARTGTILGPPPNIYADGMILIIANAGTSTIAFVAGGTGGYAALAFTVAAKSSQLLHWDGAVNYLWYPVA